MNRSTYLVCGALVLASLGLTAVLYQGLPPTIPIHWDAAGNVDGHGPRWMAWLLGPGLMAGMLALFAALPWLSPRGTNVTAFRGSYGHIAVVVVGITGYANALVLLTAGGMAIDVPRAVLGGVALALALIGNLMGKVRKNFWIGIRTPWTLASDKVWYLTHRLAGKTIVGASALALVLLLLPIGAPLELVTAVLIAGPLVPALYSLACYKRLEAAGE
ncbi:SdpI family protein [Massilia sp. SYSU DXS3249]